MAKISLSDLESLKGLKKARGESGLRQGIPSLMGRAAIQRNEILY